ncbi:MAG: PEP-CTERM sorting domain-containing protein [Planctomycetota bacterium]|nr:PEP-CTERM sorting domain-containing protein [Planctomycetota bacterium]
MRRTTTIAAVAAAVLAMTASVRGSSIGINLCTGDADSQVAPTLADGYVVQTSWNNWESNGSFTGGTWINGPVDSTGAPVTSGLAVQCGISWGLGWDYYWEYGRQCSATRDSLGAIGWCAQYGPTITVSNIPYARYSVAVLCNDWLGLDALSWHVETNRVGSTYTTPSYELAGGSMCAIQIIDAAGQPSAQLTSTHANHSAISLGAHIALSTSVTDTSLTLGNAGPTGCLPIRISAATFAGTNAALFALSPGFATAVLPGPSGIQNYGIEFLGSALPGTYTATLTFTNDSPQGNVTYNLSATVVPEPATLTLLALSGLAAIRKRRAALTRSEGSVRENLVKESKN